MKKLIIFLPVLFLICGCVFTTSKTVIEKNDGIFINNRIMDDSDVVTVPTETIEKLTSEYLKQFSGTAILDASRGIKKVTTP
jgi:hypothetical protein